MLFSLFFSFSLFAHPEKLTTITGKNINLKTINHSFAGSIKKRMVQGFKKSGKFESEISILEKDQKFSATFKTLENKSFGGDLSLPGKNGQLISHSIRLTKFSREENEYLFNFDGKSVVVSVKAEDFKGGHYINPTYSMNYKGEDISFKLKNGEACYGYSAHLIAMIMGVYIF